MTHGGCGTDEAGLITALSMPRTPEEHVESLQKELRDITARVEEREADMHARIRGEYDKTIADCWRQKVAELEEELAKERERADKAEARACAELLDGGEADRRISSLVQNGTEWQREQISALQQWAKEKALPAMELAVEIFGRQNAKVSQEVWNSSFPAVEALRKAYQDYPKPGVKL